MQTQYEDELRSYEQRAVEFIQMQVKNAGMKGVVFGLSGGIDSAVIAFLCKRAMGENCLAVLMPNTDFTPDSETNDGIVVATQLKLRFKILPIEHISKSYVMHDSDVEFRDYKHKQLVIGNLNARIRANILYHEAQKNNYLVVGTDDKSEYLIGYFTKYGDGASDMLPIAELYKTEVKRLGAYLGVPQNIINKQSSPHLWKNHVAGKEIGANYDTVDIILRALVDGGMTVDEASRKLLIPKATVSRIHTMYVRSEHKRHLPPIARLKK